MTLRVASLASAFTLGAASMAFGVWWQMTAWRRVYRRQA